jgi:DNA-binding beta-propeller fold protein YncE
MRFDLMKRCTCVALSVLGLSVIARAADAPLRFVTSIALPHVEGRIDHLSFDSRTLRLFVAALGNNTVEVLDTKAGTHLTSLPGFNEPQGIAIVPDARITAVANRRNGQVQLFSTDDFRRGAVLQPGDNADNVRYDANANRLYVGFGSGAIGAIDPGGGKFLGQAAVPGHPESFQLERSGSRIFVNVPTANQVAVIDRAAMRVVAAWRVSAASACFPMALDEANHRLFIGCRRPATVLVLDTSSGRRISSFAIVGDTDDLFYDAARKRLYVSGGDGFIDVIEEQTPNTFTRIAHVETAAGARTALFVADQSRFYLAVPHRDSQRGEIRVYDIR